MLGEMTPNAKQQDPNSDGALQLDIKHLKGQTEKAELSLQNYSPTFTWRHYHDTVFNTDMFFSRIFQTENSVTASLGREDLEMKRTQNFVQM